MFIYENIHICTYCMHTRRLHIYMFIYEDIHVYIVYAYELTPYIYEYHVYATIYIEATRQEATACIYMFIYEDIHIYSVCIRGDSIYI